MWEAGDQFAYWAAQNNISGNFGATYNGAGNLGVTGSLNGQPLDLNGEGVSIDRGVANAGISLFNQFAQMSGGSTGYRPLDRGLIPVVNAEPLIFNGAWYYDPSNPIFNYSLEQAQFNAWCQRASGRVELTDSPIDFLLGAGIGKAVFKGSSRLVGGVVTRTSSKLVGRVAAKGGSTTLYRAVSKAELDDIVAYGLRNRAGAYETGKLFAPTLKEATTFGRNNFIFDKLPNTLIKVKVPNSVMKNVYRFPADGMNAISIPANQLKYLKATPLNYSPF